MQSERGFLSGRGISTLDPETVADGVEHLSASLDETCVVAWAEANLSLLLQFMI